MKAVIPAAGLGTRFLPIAKAVPKEMLPLGDKPVIHHVVEEAAGAGFDEVLIVISRGKESIREYFAPNPELEEHLRRKGKTEALAAVREATSLAKVEYVYQEEMRGLGDALLCARDFVGSDSVFAVLLGDTVMQHASPLAPMTRAWDAFEKPSVCLEPCPEERVSRYGVAGGHALGDGIYKLDRLVEKPSPSSAPRLVGADSRPLPYHAFAARYLFTRAIFDCLDRTLPGYAGEIQLTDAMELLRQSQGMLGVTWPGKRIDIGDPSGLVEAARLLGL